MLPLCSSAPGKHLLDCLIVSAVAKANMIHQKVSFTASTSAWFSFYLDSKEHVAVFDDRVTISRKVGARFTAFSGMLRGRN